ncbi:Alpha/Beta hydrolase protein [Chaetomidium leptoderma]|uniref:Alpha/Beta hydrolase protein n=1 Tax=Chaetomidium leptoderma TaxID=669021 RepID=A0AAN6ZTI6_9PEZI|nr:Alpha/Beta hydrolase protein [Chaetomidium leptoderma]
MDFSVYGTLSDQWTALEAALPPPAQTTESYATLRKRHNSERESLAAQGLAALAPRLITTDYAIPTRDGATLEARTYQLKPDDRDGGALPVYMHFHGGGFHVGSLSSEDGICARIAVDTGVLVLNVNYRHTPEHTYPAAFHDAADAFAWLHAHAPLLGADPARVILGGISAGANLTVSVLVARHLRLPGWAHLADLPEPLGQVLMTPCLYHVACRPRRLDAGLAPSAAGASYEQHKNAPVLPLWKIHFFLDQLKAPLPIDPEDYVLNPGNMPPEKARGLPPATFGISGADPLRDEGLLFAKMLSERGVPTNVNVFPGMPHAFRRYGDALLESAHWDAVMHGGIKWALSRPEATGNFEIKDK